MFTASENPGFWGQYMLIDIIHEKCRRDNSFFVPCPGKYPTLWKPERGFFLQNDKDPPARPEDLAACRKSLFAKLKKIMKL